MNHPAPELSIGLDRSTEPWRGTFPGLGEVQVDAAGEIHVVAAQDSATELDSVTMREAALRYGWGEALSWVRRGYMVLRGGATSPDPERGCVLLAGDLHEFGRLLPDLTEAGWSFLSDRYTPAEWVGDDLIAHPRTAPILLAARRAAKVGWTGEVARGDTDALAVAVPRIHQPTRVIGVLELSRAKPGDEVFEELSGHQRFEVAASLRSGGVMLPDDLEADASPEVDPDSVMLVGRHLPEQLRFSRLPIARLRCASETSAEPTDAARVVQWWETLAGGAG